MAEQLSNIKGYVAVKEQVAAGTPVIPDVFAPLYEEDLFTEMNLEDDTAIVGNKAARWTSRPGFRSHMGPITVLAEPNTAAYFMGMLYKRGSVSGGGPYTWPFTPEDLALPYTVEVQRGNAAFRIWDVKAKSIKPTFNDNTMRFEIELAGLGSFTVREVASISGSGTYTITFKTTYDQNPTKGLVAGDVMTFYDVSAGTSTSFTVASVASETTITTTTNLATLADGDLVYLRGRTPSYTVLTPFSLAKTEFCFGVDASTALSATQTRLETDSEYSLMHNFQNDGGEQRSGSFDPAAIVHTLVDAEFKAKRYFDDLTDYNRFVTVAKRACVIRHYAGESNEYELRVTLNNLKASVSKPPLRSGEIIYNEIEFKPEHDDSDGQILDVKVLNNLGSL